MNPSKAVTAEEVRDVVVEKTQSDDTVASSSLVHFEGLYFKSCTYWIITGNVFHPAIMNSIVTGQLRRTFFFHMQDMRTSAEGICVLSHSTSYGLEREIIFKI